MTEPFSSNTSSERFVETKTMLNGETEKLDPENDCKIIFWIPVAQRKFLNGQLDGTVMSFKASALFGPCHCPLHLKLLWLGRSSQTIANIECQGDD